MARSRRSMACVRIRLQSGLTSARRPSKFRRGGCMGSSKWLPMLMLCGLACGSGEEPHGRADSGASGVSSEVDELSPTAS